MPNRRPDRIGRSIPPANLARLIDGQVEVISAADAIGLGRTLVVGLPGAFTPVCSRQHAPAMVANAGQMREAGFGRVLCIVASDPFVTDAWARDIDPEEKVTFLSDGNLEFARAFDLATSAPELFIDQCSERYLMIFDGGRLVSCKVESSITDYICTNPNVLVLEDS